jgi:hypothetical protein
MKPATTPQQPRNNPAGLGVCGGGGGRPMGSPWWQNPPSSAVSQLHHPGPRPFGGVIRPCASACLGGRLGQRSSVFCGVLVRESRATSLAGARWGLFPGLYRRPFGGFTVTLIHSTPQSSMVERDIATEQLTAGDCFNQCTTACSARAGTSPRTH